MKTIFFLVSLFLTEIVHAQYYYNDIMGARAMDERMKDYRTNKVKRVTATGYDGQGAKTSDFNEWQEISPDQNILKITIRNGQQVTRQYYQFDSQFRLAGITDSSAHIKSVSVYLYDPNNNITSIKTVTQDQDSLTEFSETEERQWKYNAARKPEKMWRIINGKDSIEYRFTLDQAGNVADEQLYRRGSGMEPIYYYYDESNRLTDIVRYDKRIKNLLPDVMFEYDDSNRVIQKITTLSTITREYLIWRFLFNENGLKTKEALFNKQKELTGRIDYQYTF
jgi:hypothetical protein